jgi:hypothetical protein
MSIPKILRSLIDVDGDIPQQDLLKNFLSVQQAQLPLADAEDLELWQYLSSFAQQYGKLPHPQSITDYLERENEVTTLERLKEVISIRKTYSGADFEHLVFEEVERDRTQTMHIALKTANDILFDGLTLKEKGKTVTYRGYRDALNYLMSRADLLTSTAGGARTRADIVDDTQSALDEFERVLTADKLTWGCITGLDDIDVVCRGIKPGELWTHAAFTSELKTTFALNWAYRATFLLQWNVYYLSLEMPVDTIQRIMYVMHANHPKFQGKGWPKITYRLIRDGEDEEGNPISPEQEEFYRHIIADVEENKGKAYGSLFVHSPDEDMTVPKLKQALETRHAQTPVHMCVLDHFALMKPEKHSGNYYTDLNSILRDSKRLSLTFNQGERIAVLGLLQINRNGKLEAEKNDGVYKMQALADANEAERSSDVITTTFLNQDLRARGRTRFGCLKNRDNPHFAPFTALIEWDTKYLSNEVDFGNHAQILNAGSDEEIQQIMEHDALTDLQQQKVQLEEQEARRAASRTARQSSMDAALEGLDEDFESDHGNIPE